MVTLTPTRTHVLRSSSLPRSGQTRLAPGSPRRARMVVAPQAMGPQEIGRLAVTIITTGLALRTSTAQGLPPSQLLTATAVAAAGTAYASAGLPAAGVDPTLLASSTYALYRAWRTYDAAPHAVGLRAGVDRYAGHDLFVECVTLAALADGAARASAQVGLGAYALAAASLTPALWAAARTASEEGVSKRYPAAAALESLPAKISLGLLGTLAATVAAGPLGGPAAAVAASLWASSQFFPQDDGG